MSLFTRTLFSVFVAVVVSAATGLFGLVSAEHAASKVNYCLSSALEIPSVQDLKNLVFEECIHQQIQDEEVSHAFWLTTFIQIEADLLLP